MQIAQTLPASSQFGEIGGTWEDIQALAKKSPQAIRQVIYIVNRSGKYLPQIVKIVDRAGDQIPKVLTLVEKLSPYMDVAVSAAEDPALPAVMKRIRTLRAMKPAKPTKSTKPSAKPPTAKGIGLRRVVTPLNVYIYIRKHPWVPYVVGGVALLLLVGGSVGIGYVVGRRKKV